MASNYGSNQEMERALREHFEAEAEDLRAPQNLWQSIEGQMDLQPTRHPVTQVRRKILGALKQNWFPMMATGGAVAVAASAVIVLSNTGGEIQVVTKEVPVERTVIKEVPVEKVVRETVVKEVPVERMVEKSVTRAPAAQAAPSYTAPAAPPARPPATTFQDYGRQPFVATAEDAVSTFSLDTDRASYQLALSWLQEGYDIEPDSVRAEEWINAFNYGYEMPADDWGFAVTSDVALHPLEGDKHLVRVGFQAAEVAEDRPLNVTLVLDASGSMNSGNRVDTARAAAEAIRQSLRP